MPLRSEDFENPRYGAALAIKIKILIVIQINIEVYLK